MFGTPTPPELPYTAADVRTLALKVVGSRITVPGVQAKLSLDVEGAATRAPVGGRLTLVGLWGRYILKPPFGRFPHLPEVEDCTMHLAALSGIRTVPHALLRLRSGELTYITRRIDRTDTGMLHMEDMCQASGRLTEHKYHGSHEQIARLILRCSTHPYLDAGYFYDQVLFSFLTGNADMHLKNFSLIKMPDTGWILAPAYDLVATALLLPEDREELALTLDGRKSHLTLENFRHAFAHAGLEPSAFRAMLRRFTRALPAWMRFIDGSFLPPDLGARFKELITERATRLGLMEGANRSSASA